MQHHLRPPILLICLWLAMAGSSPPLLAAPPLEEGTILARYERALASFNGGRQAKAQQQFQNLLRNPDLPADLRDNCSYWLGETHYAQRAWLEALGCFTKVLEHAQSNKEEDARLKIALCWQNLGEPERACLEAGTLVERFPNGEAAPRARRLLERCRPRG